MILNVCKNFESFQSVKENKAVIDILESPLNFRANLINHFTCITWYMEWWAHAHRE